MQFKAQFRCASGCNQAYSLNQIIYRCEQCGGLLQVVHDMGQLRKRHAKSWIELFEKRYMRTIFPYGSGVWGKKELVCPNVEDKNVISMYEEALRQPSTDHSAQERVQLMQAEAEESAGV